MKKLFLIPALIVSLSACGGVPISIGVGSANYDFSTTPPTSGNVLYPASASSFAQSPVNVSSVEVSGQASATTILGTPTVTAAIYGRTTDPALDKNCSSFGVMFSCPAASQTKLSGDLVLSPIKVNFKLSGETLKTAVNTGKVWFGLEVKAGFSASMTLKLTDMVAVVTLF